MASSDPGTPRTSRLRKLTPEGQELYETNLQKFVSKLRERKQHIDYYVQKIQHGPKDDIQTLQRLKTDLEYEAAGYN